MAKKEGQKEELQKEEVQKEENINTTSSDFRNMGKKFTSKVIKTSVPKFIRTGSFVMDYVLGGGIRCGKLVEFHGKFSSGKTTISLLAAAQAQLLGIPVLFLDYERGFDEDYAQALGVNMSPDLLHVARPNTIEEGGDILHGFLSMDKSLFIIVDSIPAMMPESQFKLTDVSEGAIGSQSKSQSVFFNVLSKVVPDQKCYCILLNQIRDNISMTGANYGPKKKSYGGNALDHYMHVKIEFKIDKLEHEEMLNTIDGKVKKTVIGQHVRVYAEKNKTSDPHREGIIFLSTKGIIGVDNVKAMIEAGQSLPNCITKTGAHYTIYSEDKQEIVKAHGSKALTEKIENDPELIKYLLTRLGWPSI